MKRVIFGMLLSAMSGVSNAGNLVIDNSSQISFSGYDRQSAAVMNFNFADNAGIGHTFNNSNIQQKTVDFAFLKGQTSRYGSFDYLLGFSDSYKGDADYDHFAVGVAFTSTAPVSEPQTYAMMLAGLGLLGVSMRRHKDEYFD